MKKAVCLLISVLLLFISCKKNKAQENVETCDIQKIHTQNSSKVSIAKGVWGTVSIRQGNCMPMVGPAASTCTECAIQREVRIYAYTKNTNATPAMPVNGLYDSFNTQLIKTVTTDAQGFFEADLPDGKYTIVFIEEGKLYAGTGDGQGGISRVEIQQAKVNLNLVLNWAVY